MSVQFENCLEILSEVLNVLKGTHQYERVFHLIVYRLARLYNCQTTAVVLISSKTEYLNIVNSFGLSLTFCNEFRKKLATGAMGELLWTGKSILITDSEANKQLSEEVQMEHPFGSCICVQISVDHRTIGYLHADCRGKNAFGEEDIRLFRIFADITGLAYFKSQLYEENLRLERIDRETGVEKYAPFIEKVKTAIGRAADYGEQFNLILLDVDNFKNITNTYGHDVSLELLKQLAEIVRLKVPHVHALGRYGFDEYIIMMEKTDMSEAVKCAEQLKQAVSEASFTKHNLKSSISIGISSFPQNANNLEDLIVTAKNALFEAQRAGKNRVFYYTKEWYSKAN